MNIIQKYMKKYAVSRRGTFISQTTTCEINGEMVHRRIPEAAIPVFPVLSFKSLFSLLNKKPVNVLDHGYARIPVTAARYAISHALAQMQISPGTEILLPAYHCTVMVAPIVKMGGIPVFFKISAALDADIEDIRKKITDKTKAIIAVNYCGFVQNMAEVKSLCQKKNIILIEDCAHSFFGQKNGVTVGGYGDYTLVSARKFFPVDEGGLLLIRQVEGDLPQQQPQTFTQSLKSFLSLIERSLKFGHLWLLAPFIDLFNFFNKLFKNHKKKNITLAENDHNMVDYSSERNHTEKGENTYDHRMMDKKPVLVNRLLPTILNSVKITERRCENYQWLAQGFKNMKHCKLIIEALPEGIVPFMLPVYIENLDKYFPAFEDAAVPMQRFAQFLWPDVTEETCKVTADYSRNVILFPCHQELSLQDIQWLESTIRTILEQD